MLFKDISIVDENFEIKDHMYVGVKDAYIKYIGDKEPTEDYGEVYEGKDRLIVPSFYNMHSHLPMALLRGYAENLPLIRWLNDMIFPFEGHLTEDDMYWGALMGMAESFRYGIGCMSDMYLNEMATGRAFAESGAKGDLCSCVMCFEDSGYYDLPYYQKTLNAIKAFDRYDNDRVRVVFSLHAEYTSTPRVARELAEAVMLNNSRLHIHVSETKSEVEECKERHGGCSPIQYLNDCGLFDVPALAAHCVHIDDEDIAILKKKDVTVATNPKSNLKLASGICPVTKLLFEGVNVAMGTDSVASNNSINMIEEMRFMNYLQKGITLDPTVMTPQETLYAGTRAGAIGQGRDDCGLIKEGFHADITVFRTDTICNQPAHNRLNNLIYSASGDDVVMTMVDGKVLYKDGLYTTLDIEKIKYEVENRRVRILGELAE